MKPTRPLGGALFLGVLACGGDSGATDTAASETTETTAATSSTSAPTTGASPTTTAPDPTTTPTTGDDPDPTTAAPDDTTTTVTTEPGTSSTGGPPNTQCEGSGLAICEGFEDAADGGFPAGWGARGDEWGEGVIGVASDTARLGARALKVDGGDNGQHFMDYKGDLGALATHHYGRVFLKVATPAPWPADGVLHADFIEGLGPGPKGGTHNVRWGVVENTGMAMQWIFNVQPSNGDPEFGEGTAYDYAWTGEWQCLEWFYDQPSQQGGLWIDGVQLPIVPGQNHAAEIPVFSSLGVGLANYQSAGAGFTVWFDELAYDPERIGCDI